MDAETHVKTNMTVELKVIRADGTEEMIGVFPVYQAADEPLEEDSDSGE